MLDHQELYQKVKGDKKSAVMVRFQVDIQIIASRVCKQTYVQHTPHVPLHMKCILD